MGPKMWPSTPLMVKSGTKLAMMMAAEKKMERLTWAADSAITASLAPVRCWGCTLELACSAMWR